jgi:phage shock protein A
MPYTLNVGSSSLLGWFRDRLRRLLRRAKAALGLERSGRSPTEEQADAALVELEMKLLDAKRQVARAITDERWLERQHAAARDHLATLEARAAEATGADDGALAESIAGHRRVTEAFAREHQAQRDRVERLKVALRGLHERIEAHKLRRTLLALALRVSEADRTAEAALATLTDPTMFEEIVALEGELERALERHDIDASEEADTGAAEQPAAAAPSVESPRALLERATSAWRTRLADVEARLRAVIEDGEKIAAQCNVEERMELEWATKASAAVQAGEDALAAEALRHAREHRARREVCVRHLRRRSALVARMLERFAARP